MHRQHKCFYHTQTSTGNTSASVTRNTCTGNTSVSITRNTSVPIPLHLFSEKKFPRGMEGGSVARARREGVRQGVRDVVCEGGLMLSVCTINTKMWCGMLPAVTLSECATGVYIDVCVCVCVCACIARIACVCAFLCLGVCATQECKGCRGFQPRSSHGEFARAGVEEGKGGQGRGVERSWVCCPLSCRAG